MASTALAYVPSCPILRSAALSSAFSGRRIGRTTAPILQARTPNVTGQWRSSASAGNGSNDSPGTPGAGSAQQSGKTETTATTDGGRNDATDMDGSLGIVSTDLRNEMSKSYMEYAMSVILGRALPDVRDGLKPVHRRILFAMHGLGLGSTSQYRKCARVVGEVLGKYHPHGDTAVYDALVRMAQPFSMSIPLIDGHGNFGSTDGDPAAAMRYTECRLSPVSKGTFLADLELDTIDFGPNFDGSEEEPLVLPSRIPNLLVNGSSGIAVGMATNVPPHNLGELVNALTAMVRDPSLSDAQLLAHVPAPDFPTGGQILGSDGPEQLYRTGRGRVLVRATAHFENLSSSGSSTRKSPRQAIVITELPYQVNKAHLVEKIAELVNDKKLEGIADLRDESDRSGTRVVVELKRDAEREVVLNNLYKKTSLQHAFSGNLLALDKGRHPMRFTLRECMERFLDFRREVIRRRATHDLKRAKERLHMVEGYIKAQRKIDTVVSIIRSSESPKDALAGLQAADIGLTETQADAVLSMQLRRLTALEQGKLDKEAGELGNTIKECNALLAEPDLVSNVIIRELEEQAALYGTPRRSRIVEGDALDAAEIDELSLLVNEQCIIVVTRKGYIKRMRTNEFESQNRGTRGKRGMANSGDTDSVAHFFTCNTHDRLVAVSRQGQAFGLPAHKVPIASRTSRGVPFSAMVSGIGPGEDLAYILPISEFPDDEYLALLTSEGLVKKTALSAFENISAAGKRIINLREGDQLKWVRRCTAKDLMIIGSAKGYALLFQMNNESVRESTRQSLGRLAMRLRDGDRIVDMDIVPANAGNDQSALVVTTDGLGKRVPVSDFTVQKRGRMGMIASKFKNDWEGEMLSLQVCQDADSLMVASKLGTIVRMGVTSIPSVSRRSRPFVIQRLDDGDEVAAATILPPGAGNGDDTSEDSLIPDETPLVDVA